jgi:hypothetical protein
VLALRIIEKVRGQDSENLPGANGGSILKIDSTKACGSHYPGSDARRDRESVKVRGFDRNGPQLLTPCQLSRYEFLAEV